MTTGDDTIVRRYADAMQRRGTQIVLRRTTLAGRQGPNLPSVTGALLNGMTYAGAETIAIRATAASGRIIAGDRITIGTRLPISVVAEVVANAPDPNPAVVWAPGFTGVHLSSPLPRPAADGNTISFIWSADAPVWVTVESFGSSLANTDIVAGDLDIEMAAYGIARPVATNMLLIGDEIRTVVQAQPKYYRGFVVAWKIQAR